MSNCVNIKLTVGNYKMKAESLLSDDLTVDKELWEVEITPDTKVEGDGSKEVYFTLPNGEQKRLYVDRTKIIHDVAARDLLVAASPYTATLTYAGLLLLVQNMTRARTVPGNVDLTAYPAAGQAKPAGLQLLPWFGYRGFLYTSSVGDLEGFGVPTMLEEHTIFFITDAGVTVSQMLNDNGGGAVATDILTFGGIDGDVIPNKTIVLRYDYTAGKWRTSPLN